MLNLGLIDNKYSLTTKEYVDIIPIIYTQKLLEVVGYERVRENVDFYLRNDGIMGLITNVDLQGKTLKFNSILDSRKFALKEHKHIEYIDEQKLQEIIPTYISTVTNIDRTCDIQDVIGLQDALDNKQPTGDYVTDTSLNNKGYVIESIANSRYATKQELRDLQLTPGPKGADGTSVVVEVVSSPPSDPVPNTLYLVRA